MFLKYIYIRIKRYFAVWSILKKRRSINYNTVIGTCLIFLNVNKIKFKGV